MPLLSILRSSLLKPIKGVFGASLLILCSMTVQADDKLQAAEPQWLMAKYDLNGDARITQQEITHKKLALFNRMDRNGSGDVSFSEYENMDQSKRQALLKARFLKLDDNHDGLVSQEEYASFLGMFASIDANGDGALSPHEMTQDEAKQSKEDNQYCLLWLCVRTSLDW
ncbi:EF-hand domain-containing protein [Pseudomaricurvus alkylphenolicus]|uniref:EF-hand domain-containing protein n=1 Tax=Pseudomaricurvus alkylphenolicus TaxID=1306991 RepID=UPI001F0F02C3|nr:hypothetical protein [Pseudomaricurvus alkylphenolicus]